MGLLLGLSVLSADWVVADTLILKNGRRMTGRVVKEDEKELQFETQGVVLTFPRRSIQELQQDSSEKNELEKLKQAYNQGDLFRTYNETLEFLQKFPTHEEVRKINHESEGKLQDLIDRRIDDALILQNYVDGMSAVEEWLENKVKPRTPLYSYYSKRYVKLGLTYAEKLYQQAKDGQDYRRLLPVLEKIERHAEEPQEIIIMRARTLFACGEYQAVERLLEANITDSELKREKQSLLIRALLFQDKFREVSDLTREIDLYKIMPGEVQKQILARMPIALSASAYEAYNEGNYVAAKNYFRRYMEVAPDDIPTHQKAVEFYGMLRDDQMLHFAKQELERAIRKEKARSGQVYTGPGEAEYIEVNRMDRAVNLANKHERSILLIFEEDQNPNSQLLRGHMNDLSVRRSIAKYFVVVFLNLSAEGEGKTLAFRYSVQNAPALLILGRDRVKYGEIPFHPDVPAFLDNFYKAMENFLGVARR